jgi:hypothetical protein
VVDVALDVFGIEAAEEVAGWIMLAIGLGGLWGGRCWGMLTGRCLLGRPSCCCSMWVGWEV